jgi:hypothetical protein
MQKKSAKNGFSVPREEERGLVEAAGIDPALHEAKSMHYMGNGTRLEQSERAVEQKEGVL